MDITLLVGLLAFFAMAAAWVMLPTGQETPETATAPAAAPHTSKA
jgi:hypothetical protein